jgi:hypothetical protein
VAAKPDLRNTTDTPGSYQQALRDAEGWHDLTDRARALREQAAICRQTHARIQSVEAAFAASYESGKAALIRELKAAPDDPQLLRICIAQGSTLIRQQQFAEALQVIRIGLDYGQGQLTATLRNLQIVAQIEVAYDGKRPLEVINLAEQLPRGWDLEILSDISLLVRERLESLYSLAISKLDRDPRFKEIVNQLENILTRLFPEWKPDKTEFSPSPQKQQIEDQHTHKPQIESRQKPGETPDRQLLSSPLRLTIVAVVLIAIGFLGGMQVMSATSHGTGGSLNVPLSAVASPTPGTPLPTSPVSTPPLATAVPTATTIALEMLEVNQSASFAWTYDFPRAYYALSLEELADRQAEQGRFVVVLMHVINQTGQDQPLPPGFFQLVDHQNRRYPSRPDILQAFTRSPSADMPGMIDLTERDVIPADGNYRRIQLVFDIADDATDLKIFAPDGPAVGWSLSPVTPQQVSPLPDSSPPAVDIGNEWRCTLVAENIRRDAGLVAVRVDITNLTEQLQSIPPLLLVLRDHQGRAYLHQPTAAAKYRELGGTLEAPPLNAHDPVAGNATQAVLLVFAVAPDAADLLLFTPADPDQGWHISE